MVDANIRIPVEARDRLAEIAAAEGMSLRAYLARMADTLLTPAERAERAVQARAALQVWNGYDPSPQDEEQLDQVLDSRIAEAVGERSRIAS
jgi:hypothetical protein